MKSALLIFMVIFQFAVIADDHGIGKLTGHDIALEVVDHSLAGRIKDKLVLIDIEKTNGHRQSDLFLKDSGAITHHKFMTNAGTISGNMNTESRSHIVQITRIDFQDHTLYLKVNNIEYKVRIEADDFRNNHFYNPSYILEKDNEEIIIKLQDGHACFMMSAQIVLNVFGSYFL